MRDSREFILQIAQLNKTYSGNQVLNNVNFDLKLGEVHALVGENGAGKSTLIKIIAGVEKPDPGAEIIFDGCPAVNLSPSKSVQMGISVIYQDISLFPNLSVAENICIGGQKGPFIKWQQMFETARSALNKLGAIDIDPHMALGEISIGQRQMVALARALTHEARVIIMDEPTSSLSANEVKALYNTIQILKNENKSLIYISHKFEEVFRVADRISVLRDGELIASKDAREFDEQSLISMMVGREIRFPPLHNEEVAGKKIFEVTGLSKEPLFRDISFSLYENEILGMTGLVGAGRSEMAQTLFGLIKADKGRIFMGGKEISIKSAVDAIKNGICYLPEDRRGQGIFRIQSMAKNITAAKLESILNRYRLLSRPKEMAVSEYYMDRLNIKPRLPDISADKMSGGNQQKVLFSRWLNARPRILIADEPSSGIDVATKAEIHKLLRELAASGVGVILISSDLPETLAVCDRILVMRNGNIVEQISSMESSQEELIRKGLMG
ncbi:MAG: sugar ABC transporter ATP-binding protein [Syntrophomonadaceae bacterium]|nr:sugar ABC transporter ATP-binding protein [Syntrophomonadaceae bacterium]